MTLLHLGSEPRVCFPIYNRNPRFFLSSSQTFSLLHVYRSSVLPSTHVLRRLGRVLKTKKELGQHEKDEAKCSLSPHLPAAVSPAPVAQPREQTGHHRDWTGCYFHGRNDLMVGKTGTDSFLSWDLLLVLAILKFLESQPKPSQMTHTHTPIHPCGFADSTLANLLRSWSFSSTQGAFQVLRGHVEWWKGCPHWGQSWQCCVLVSALRLYIHVLFEVHLMPCIFQFCSLNAP